MPAQPKVSKRSSPHHSVPRLGSACPHSGLNPWAAAMGHPWPSAANPASCRVAHGFKPAFGQRGLTGRLRSKAKSKAEQKQVNIYLMCGDQTVGGGLPPMAVGQSQMCLLTLPHREQAPSHICNEYRQPESVGSKAASLCF